MTIPTFTTTIARQIIQTRAQGAATSAIRSISTTRSISSNNNDEQKKQDIISRADFCWSQENADDFVKRSCKTIFLGLSTNEKILLSKQYIAEYAANKCSSYRKENQISKAKEGLLTKQILQNLSLLEKGCKETENRVLAQLKLHEITNLNSSTPFCQMSSEEQSVALAIFRRLQAKAKKSISHHMYEIAKKHLREQHISNINGVPIDTAGLKEYIHQQITNTKALQPQEPLNPMRSLSTHRTLQYLRSPTFKVPVETKDGTLTSKDSRATSAAAQAPATDSRTSSASASATSASTSKESISPSKSSSKISSPHFSPFRHLFNNKKFFKHKEPSVDPSALHTPPMSPPTYDQAMEIPLEKRSKKPSDVDIYFEDPKIKSQLTQIAKDTIQWHCSAHLKRNILEKIKRPAHDSLSLEINMNQIIEQHYLSHLQREIDRCCKDEMDRCCREQRSVPLYLGKAGEEISRSIREDFLNIKKWGSASVLIVYAQSKIRRKQVTRPDFLRFDKSSEFQEKLNNAVFSYLNIELDKMIKDPDAIKKFNLSTNYKTSTEIKNKVTQSFIEKREQNQ